MSNLPCPVVVLDENPTPENIAAVAQAIREACSVSLEENARRWRAHRDALGIPHPQEDPKGFERWLDGQYARYAANRPTAKP